MRAEAVLLMAGGPLSPRKLADLAGLPDATAARTLVRDLNQQYDDLDRAMRIETVAGGLRMMTRTHLAGWLSRLSHLPTPLRLSPPMLETLAVVAYRQPVSRADAEAIRGVACGETLRQLISRDLVRVAGRSEELGRPYLYGTTKRFLQTFGLRSLDALPPIDSDALLDTSDSTPSPPDPAVPEDNRTKEPVVSIATLQPSSAEPQIKSQPAMMVGQIDPASSNPAPSDRDVAAGHAAVIEDEENEHFDSDEDWDDDEDDNWDDPDDDDEIILDDEEEDDEDEVDDEDEDDVEDEDEDSDDDDDDDELDDDWEEVGDDEEDDAEDDFGDDEDDWEDAADDDEDWS